MGVEVMDRRANENLYLHRDFHRALNAAVRYVHEHHGEDAVRSWLRDFARAWYAPLREALMRGDLDCLRQHIERTYGIEGVAVKVRQGPDALTVEVPGCPAEAYIRACGEDVAGLFFETTRTVNEAICEGTPYRSEFRGYDPATGAATQTFRRGPP
ncbi:MAG: hypothetical protein JXR77_06175 [Lentisphaeria bacterium]|nr:hypothetical protein [Lentisphaeria bacterium]